MTIKILDADCTNDILLHLLPFETGYLLKTPKEDEELTDEDLLAPCMSSVQLAVMLRSVEFTMHPQNATKVHNN